MELFPWASFEGVKGEEVTMPLGKVEIRAVYRPRRVSSILGTVAVLAALGVVTVLVLPSIQGPYSAVNGPATAFRCKQSAAKIHTAIVQTATHRVLNPIATSHPIVPPTPAMAAHVAERGFHEQCVGEYAPILRC